LIDFLLPSSGTGDDGELASRSMTKSSSPLSSLPVSDPGPGKGASWLTASFSDDDEGLCPSGLESGEAKMGLCSCSGIELMKETVGILDPAPVTNEIKENNVSLINN